MNLLSLILNLAVRIVVVAVSIVVFLALLVVGLAVLVGVVLWSLLRGRKPTVHTAMFKRAGSMGAQAFGRRPPPSGEIVDVEVREVREDGAPAANDATHDVRDPSGPQPRLER